MPTSLLWKSVVAAPREVYDVAADKFMENLPWALAAIGIGLGGVIVAFIFIKLAECWTNARSRMRFEYDERHHRFKETTQMRSQSFIRLIAMSLAILSLVFGFWIAAHTAGFNFWTVILGYGILSLVGTYAFGSTLRNAGAFFLISLTDKIEENWVVSIGNNIRGRIVAIHILWVELHVDLDVEQGGQGRMPIEIHVPTWQFIDGIVRRDMNLERQIRNRMHNNSPTISSRPKTF